VHNAMINIRLFMKLGNLKEQAKFDAHTRAHSTSDEKANEKIATKT